MAFMERRTLTAFETVGAQVMSFPSILEEIITGVTRVVPVGRTTQHAAYHSENERNLCRWIGQAG
jgi:hypothetical protein